MKNLFKEIKPLINKDLTIEWRQKSAISGVILYIVGTIFICYLSFSVKSSKISPPVWNALLWIVLLFSSINAVSRSFLQEKKGRLLYFYTLASSEAIIISKILYNSILMLILSSIALFFYSIVLGNPIQSFGLFYINVLLGSIGFASIFCLVSAIASKSENAVTLSTILGIPLIIPILLILIKISHQAIDNLDLSVSYDELILLASLDVLIIALSYILFPYSWRS